MQECSPATLLMADPSVNDLCVRWKMEVLGTSCLPSWPGPEKSVRWAISDLRASRNRDPVLEQTRSLLTGWAGDAAAAGVLCAGHVTRDTCDGCWRGLAASSRCGHQTPTQNHWPRHPPPNSALPRAFQHFTSGLLWRQKYLHDKKIFARLLNSTAKPVQINIFAIFRLNCGSASTRPHHPSSSCSQERGAHRKCIKMTAVAGVAVGWCSLQTACSVIVRW